MISVEGSGCQSAASSVDSVGARGGSSATTDASDVYRRAFASPSSRSKPFITYWNLENAEDVQIDSEVTWISREAFLIAALRCVPRIQSSLGGRSLEGLRIAHYMSANRIEDGLLRLAAALTGYSVVTINWGADSFERVKYKVVEAKCAAVFYDEFVPQERIDLLMKEVAPLGIQVIPCSSLTNHADLSVEQGVVDLDAEFAVLHSDSTLEVSADATSLTKQQRPSPASERMVVFTSGTTSEPKGVRLSYGNLETACRCILDAVEVGHEQPVDFVVVNPFHHVNTSVIFETALCYPNARVHLVDRYRTTYWKVLCLAARNAAEEARRRISGTANGLPEGFRVVAPLVSRHIDFLQSLASSDRFKDEEFLLKLREAVAPKEVVLFLGSAPVGPSTVSAMKRLLGKMPKVRFGSTETSLQVAAIPFSMSDAEELKAFDRGWTHSFGGEQKPGFYIGRPHASQTELRVVRSVKAKHEEYMRDCEEGEAGYLVSRGSNAMVGYANSAKQPFSEDGWYLGFGDIAFFLVNQTDGCRDYYWMSREADVLIKGGANYSCQQISDDLLHLLCSSFSLPKEGTSVATIGIKWRSEHEDDACVTVEIPTDYEDMKPTIERDFIKKALASGGLCKGFRPDFVRVASIPKTFKGAVDIGSLRKSYIEYLERNAGELKRKETNRISN